MKTDDVANSVKKASCFTAIDHNRNQTTDKRYYVQRLGLWHFFQDGQVVKVFVISWAAQT